MSSFGDRLRAEIEYNGISQRELAERAGIKKRALDMYLGYRESMPPADIAVKIARALNVTVEYLVTGESAERAQTPEQQRRIVRDLENLTQTTLQFIETTIHLFSEHEKLMRKLKGDGADSP